MPCKKCESPQPHLHPAVQFEGEVAICSDEFHLRPTTQNTGKFIALVKSIRAQPRKDRTNEPCRRA